MKFLLLSFLSICLSPSSEAATGLRLHKTVLKGALERAGGPGGMRSLPVETLEQLCERGVDKVFYLYPDQSFTTRGAYSCRGNSLQYLGGGFRGNGLRPVLEAVQNAAMNGTGPVLVHCWNGSHAAGEAAAYALMQFCDWSGDRAADYWADTLHDKGNLGKYGSVLKRIRSFQPLSGLRLSEAAKSRVCP